MFKTLLFRFYLLVLGHLPLRLLRALGSCFGSLLWYNRRRMALVTQENIKLCFPELDPHRQALLAKHSLQETGKTIFETAYAWTRSHDHCLSVLEPPANKAQIDALFQSGRGVIFVIPHLGNWEFINHYLGHHFGLTHMYQPYRNPRLDHYILACRGQSGTNFVPTNSTGIREQWKVLKRGGAIGIMPDQEPLVHTGVFEPFFGVASLTNELTTKLAKNNAAVVLATCLRAPAVTGFKVILEPVDLSPNHPTASLNMEIEKLVRSIPDQYLWSYKRFRTRPNGEPDLYRFNHHALRTRIELGLLSSLVNATRYLGSEQSKRLAGWLDQPFWLRRRRRMAKVNLEICSQNPALLGSSTRFLIQCGLSLGRAWYSNAANFEAHLRYDLPVQLPVTGAIVLTPPLGNREVLIRYLGAKRVCREYYHPNSHSSLNKLILRARTRMGVGLVPHTEDGRAKLVTAIQQAALVTICPDQQPRLRGGAFVPFYDQLALTTLAITELVRATQCPLFVGAALQDDDGYTIRIKPVELHAGDSDEVMLHQVNATLEDLIDEAPDQYRWSDKRFNIRPRGESKVYP